MLATAPGRTRVVRHESDTGMWEAVFAAPHPQVRALVHGQYVGWTERSRSVVRRKEVPFPGIPLVFNFGPAFTLLDPEHPGAPGAVRGSFVAGLHQRFALTEAPGESCCVQVNLTPLGGFAVLGLPMHLLANQVVEFEEVLGREGRSLVARLGESSDWETRFDLVDQFLTGRAAAGPRASREVVWAWRQLSETSGAASIVQLCRELGVSRRHLAARFREEVGLSPKLIGRIMRFNRVVSLLSRNDGARWSRVAHECGYHDQSHLNHDFREFADATPSEYLYRLQPDGGGVLAD